MNKFGKNSTAMFLAATLFAGIFALISPSFIDVEASGDQRDNKHKDNRHDGSKGSSVNIKFICNNINVGGVNNNDVNHRDVVSSLAGAQAQEEGNQEVSANSMGNNERNHESIKQHDGKDFTFICVQNNNVPPVVLSDCEKCFVTTDDGGFLPPGQKTNLEDHLDEELGLTLAEFCEMVTDGEFSDAEIRMIVAEALPGNQQMLEAELSDCLIDSIEENNLTENTPLTLTP
jgi:hypothetical protein